MLSFILHQEIKSPRLQYLTLSQEVTRIRDVNLFPQAWARLIPHVRSYEINNLRRLIPHP